MMSGLILALAAVAVIGLTAFNLASAVRSSTVSAYGRAFSRNENPAAFWISVVCSLIGLLLGLVLAAAAFAGLFGIVR
jgi:hypothetical protein